MNQEVMLDTVFVGTFFPVSALSSAKRLTVTGRHLIKANGRSFYDVDHARGIVQTSAASLSTLATGCGKFIL
jgi:hypothetical protein